MELSLFPFAGGMTLAGTMLTIALSMWLAFYVYVALALMTIAKKLKHPTPWLAWIPIANVFLIAMLADKEWFWGFLIFIPIVNFVFLIIWTWRIFEKRNYPGWLALIPLFSFIPIIGMLAWIGNLVVWGLVAWSDR